VWQEIRHYLSDLQDSNLKGYWVDCYDFHDDLVVDVVVDVGVGAGVDDVDVVDVVGVADVGVVDKAMVDYMESLGMCKLDNHYQVCYTLEAHSFS